LPSVGIGLYWYCLPLVLGFIGIAIRCWREVSKSPPIGRYLPDIYPRRNSQKFFCQVFKETQGAASLVRISTDFSIIHMMLWSLSAIPFFWRVGWSIWVHYQFQCSAYIPRTSWTRETTCRRPREADTWTMEVNYPQLRRNLWCGGLASSMMSWISVVVIDAIDRHQWCGRWCTSVMLSIGVISDVIKWRYLRKGRWEPLVIWSILSLRNVMSRVASHICVRSASSNEQTS
jgi:hypothetical protein